MSKEKISPIVFKGTGDFEGREFTLDYTRKTVVKAERAGLNVQAMDSQPMTMIYLMFWGAFQAHRSRFPGTGNGPCSRPRSRSSYRFPRS